MTSTVAKPAPKLAGKALYLELVADPTLNPTEKKDLLGWLSEGTKQIIVFPEFQDDTGKVHPARVLTRTLTSHSPRAQWDWTTIASKLNPTPDPSSEGYYSGYTKYSLYSKEEWDSLPDVAKQKSKALAIKTAIANEMVATVYEGKGEEQKLVGKQGWVVRDSKPFSVELTNQDYEDLNTSKTPQAVIRRINKVRDSLAYFPTKLFSTT
jgi:hypothetical protein